MYSCHVTFGLKRDILPYRVSDNEQDTCCTVEDAVLTSISECKTRQHWTCVCNMWRAQQAKANEKGKERAGNKEKKERGNLNKKHPLLPGICLAVVFSGNNVFKQLTSGHPEMQEVQAWLFGNSNRIPVPQRAALHGAQLPWRREFNVKIVDVKVWKTEGKVFRILKDLHVWGGINFVY